MVIRKEGDRRMNPLKLFEKAKQDAQKREEEKVKRDILTDSAQKELAKNLELIKEQNGLDWSIRYPFSGSYNLRIVYNNMSTIISYDFSAKMYRIGEDRYNLKGVLEEVCRHYFATK